MEEVRFFSMSHKLWTNSKLLYLHGLLRVLDKGFAKLISYLCEDNKC